MSNPFDDVKLMEAFEAKLKAQQANKNYEEAKKRVEEENRRRVEEENRRRVEEENRRRLEEEYRRRVEEETKKQSKEEVESKSLLTTYHEGESKDDSKSQLYAIKTSFISMTPYNRGVVIFCLIFGIGICITFFVQLSLWDKEPLYQKMEILKQRAEAIDGSLKSADRRVILDADLNDAEKKLMKTLPHHFSYNKLWQIGFGLTIAIGSICSIYGALYKTDQEE